MATVATTLRDLLLATERAKQPLDAAIQRFAAAAADDARVLAALLDASPQAEPLVHSWPDESGKGTRWEDRESIALFLEILAKLLYVQLHDRGASDAAEALALKIVREKSASLEKMLSWSDKPIVEFRVLELMATIASVSATAARELVRIFNFQSAAFAKIATRRMKKAVAVAADIDPVNDDDNGGVNVSTTTSSKPAAVDAAPAFQIRAAYVRLVAALASCPDKSVHRFALKDGGVMASLFKSLDGDDAEMLATVIGHLDLLVLQNDDLDVRGRSAIFNNAAVQQFISVLKVDDESVASLAWTLLLKLFFEDGAIYQIPARHSLRILLLKANATAPMYSTDTASTDSNMENVGLMVKVIRNAMGSVGLNDYVRSSFVREMVAKFILEYPGLVAEFFSTLAPQLEPKTGYRWFCVATMVQNVLSSPLDAVLPDVETDSEGTYSASTLASRLIMPLSCRKELSRGLQHANNLVIYTSLGLVESALRRFQFFAVHAPAGVTRSELENELRFLLPSPETLVSLLMKLCTTVDNGALVYLRSLTVFRLYLEYLPLAMNEVKADFTKLLAWQYLDKADGNSRAMRGVIVGELLRVLMAVDESRLRYVVTSTSTGSADASKLSQLLRLFSSPTIDAGETVRVLSRDVLVRVFLALKVFGSEGDVSSPLEDISIWLDNMATGGDGVGGFVETLLHELVADPFAFLSVESDSSMSPSPATLALISALHRSWPYAKSKSKVEASLQIPTVGAFASRVALSLVCRSAEPDAVARLLCHDTTETSTDEEASEMKRTSKKRRLSDTIELRPVTPYQCVLAVAKRMVSPTKPWRVVPPPQTTASPWKSIDQIPVFGASLYALDSSSFVKNFAKIMTNLLRLGLTSEWIHQFIRARPDVDLIELIEYVNGTAKAEKDMGPVLRDVLHALPADLFSQRALFALSVNGVEQDVENFKKLLHQLMSRVGDSIRATPSSVALATEHVLCCVKISQSVRLTDITSALSNVFLRLQALFRYDGSRGQGLLVSRRLRSKLKRAATAQSSELKLAALDLLSLNDAADEESSSGVELLRLRHPGGSLVTIMLGRRLPTTLRLEILAALLKERSGTKRQLPIIAHLLMTLDQVDSIVGFRGSGGFVRLLWDALVSSQHKLLKDERLEVLSSALHLIGRLGGVSQAEFVEAIHSTWFGVLERTLHRSQAQQHVPFIVLLTFVRRLCTSLRRQDIVEGTYSVFEEVARLATRVSGNAKAARILMAAVTLVTSYVTSSQKDTQSDKLLTQVVQDAMQHQGLTSRMTRSQLILRHMVGGEAGSQVALFRALESVVLFAKEISTGQLLSVLLILRNRDPLECGWSANIATFLARAAVVTTGDADKRGLNAIYTMLRDLLKHAPAQKDVAAVVLENSADVKRFVDADIAADAPAFYEFVRRSRVVLELFSAKGDASAQGYSLNDHFLKLTTHAVFSSSLRDPEISVDVIRLVASMLRLGGADFYNRSVFQHLLGAYTMSLSLPDRMIRCLMIDFESNADILASQYGYRFGSSSVMDVLHKRDGSVRTDLVEDSAWLLSGGLDPSRVRATIEWFPLNRGVSVKDDVYLLSCDDIDDTIDDCDDVDDESRCAVYDPSYLLPMLARFVASSALPEAAIIQQGVVSVAVRAISSNADDVREFAYAILAHVHESLSADAATDFKPGRQVHLMLDTLRNAVQEPLEGVSSVITVFMNDTISIICRPGHPMYPHVNHFLLARPAFDLSDVPMFYSLFNSHSPQTYKQERSWLLHGLRRGVREDADVSLLIRRHVPSILLSFFGSDLADEHTQLLVCSILSAMMKTEAGATYLLTKCAFLEWLAARVHETTSAGSAVAIVQALANLFDDSLTTELWDHLNVSQHDALSSAAVICYEALATVARQRHGLATLKWKATVARVSHFVFQRASSACSLSTFKSLLAGAVDAEPVALDCVDALITSHLLTHREFQRSRFGEWSTLLADTARILSRESRVLLVESFDQQAAASSACVAREIRAKACLTRLRSVLAEVPSLRLLVLHELDGELATTTLLL